jgi:hypothetical protein
MQCDATTDESIEEERLALKAALQSLVRRDMELARRANSDRRAQRKFLIRRKKDYLEGRQQEWLCEKQSLLRRYVREEAPSDATDMRLESRICEEQWEHDLWRAAKLQFWSMPPNEYVGRRKRILIFDRGKLLGIVGIASCIWGLSDRDKWIGWTTENKYNRINHLLDAYVLGAIPPYNGKFRGSKLVATLLASEWLRKFWSEYYGDIPVLIATTTLFGHSAVLHNTSLGDRRLWKHIGQTKGMGTMHFSKEAIDTAKALLDAYGINVKNRFGDGPNWKLRLMRTALEQAELEVGENLTHGYTRWIYALELGENAREFLREETNDFLPFHHSVEQILEDWSIGQHH